VILYVEDEIDTRDAVTFALQQEGFTVFGAANGQTALDYLRSNPPPCLILLDLMVPVMDGWQFMAERARHPELLTIPVVVVSAHLTIQRQATALKAAGYLTKPIDMGQLIATVRRYC
jgi:DNA-binding response OmpR family regulator